MDFVPKAQNIEVFVKNRKLNDLKILHLSDLHINKKSSKTKILELVNYCNSLNFDFCVITGDIIDCKVSYIKEHLYILNRLKKNVYYVSGNHDFFYGLEELKKELTNFIFMDNNYTVIDHKNEIIHLAGLPDRFSKFFGVKRDENKITQFLEDSPSIFISHQPKDYKIALKCDANLFLCGHTHGGQIYPFHYLVRLIQPFVSGLFYKKNTAIYVNKGLGTWGFHFRFMAKAEISILKLISKSVKSSS